MILVSLNAFSEISQNQIIARLSNKNIGQFYVPMDNAILEQKQRGTQQISGIPANFLPIQLSAKSLEFLLKGEGIVINQKESGWDWAAHACDWIFFHQ